MIMIGKGIVALVLFTAWIAGPPPAQEPPPLELFFRGASLDERVAREALAALATQWRDSYTPMVIDLARLLRPAPAASQGGTDLADSSSAAFDPDDGGGTAGAAGAGFGQELARRPTPESLARGRLLQFLEARTGKRFDIYLNGWRQWMWSLPYAPHPDYARFKSAIYGRIDPRMQRFFPPQVRSTIRLDEIDWGGVPVNGIPPLSYPKVLAAANATFLRDGNLVFGVVVNGEARAYPKRILAWHEMAIDRLGGVELTVVYCTLCGTVIPYDSVVGGTPRRFGTSGLLYRSNKLMFDEETMSLWSMLEGKPVVGALVDTGLQLSSHAAVTTTWGEWRTEHPSTTVLSLDTGHKRDYREGAAYRDYFRNDRLYFQVPANDTRLKNKTEVLTFRVRSGIGGAGQPVAIVADFLKKTPVFHFDAADRRLLVITSKAGANRLYDLTGHDVVFQAKAPTGPLVDTAGGRWVQSETALVPESGGSVSLPRVVAQRAFWFGWHAQFPDTLLVGR